MKKGFIKGEAFGLLRSNPSKRAFKENIKNFRSHSRVRGYPDNLVNKVLVEVKFTDRKSALQQKPQKVQNGLMLFVTQYNPSAPNLKNILMNKWHLIENQPLPREIYREPPLIQKRKISKRHTSQSQTLKVKNPLHHETTGVVFSLSTSFNLLKIPRFKDSRF